MGGNSYNGKKRINSEPHSGTIAVSMKKFGGDANTPNAANLNRRFTLSNSSKLSLVLAEVDSVQFFTDAATGRSGISQSGLAALCGVTKQALSKLTKSLSTKCPSIWLKPIQGQVDILSTRTETGILLYYLCNEHKYL